MKGMEDLEAAAKTYLQAVWELSGGARIEVPADQVNERTGFDRTLTQIVLRHLLGGKRVAMPAFGRVMMTETEYLRWKAEQGGQTGPSRSKRSVGLLLCLFMIGQPFGWKFHLGEGLNRICAQ